MDLGCTYPTSENVNAFLSNCKILGLSTIAFRGAVSEEQLKELEQISQTRFGHPIHCLKRVDIRLAGNGNEALTLLSKRLTSEAADPQTSSSKRSNPDDADLLVLHLSSPDPSVLGNTSFGDLLLASQNLVVKRRGSGSRLLVVNLDCFVVSSDDSLSSASSVPMSSKAFALCKSLAKCNDLVFELSYLPWIRSHAFGGNFLTRSGDRTDDDAVSVVEALRNTSHDIISAFLKPVLISSGQIKAEVANNKPIDNKKRQATVDVSQSNIATDLLLMRSQRDISALASVLMQLRRPLVDEGLAVMRRLKHLTVGVEPYSGRSTLIAGDKIRVKAETQPRSGLKRERE